MRVFVAGATGRVATELIANLKAAGHQVVAGARKPENVADREVQSTALDLHADAKELKALVADVDAVKADRAPLWIPQPGQQCRDG